MSPHRINCPALSKSCGSPLRRTQSGFSNGATVSRVAGAFVLAWCTVYISKWPKIRPLVLIQGLTITYLGVENKNCVFPVLKEMSEKELIVQGFC